MDDIKKIEEDYKVQPVRNKYHVQKWDDRKGWVDMPGQKHKCRIEAEDAKRFIIAGLKSNRK